MNIQFSWKKRASDSVEGFNYWWITENCKLAQLRLMLRCCQELYFSLYISLGCCDFEAQVGHMREKNG